MDDDSVAEFLTDKAVNGELRTADGVGKIDVQGFVVVGG